MFILFLTSTSSKPTICLQELCYLFSHAQRCPSRNKRRHHKAHKDRATLNACSLASRSFLPFCQKRLLANILLLPFSDGRHSNATQFEKLLRYLHLGQLYSVRYLQILDCYAGDCGVVSGDWEQWLPKDTRLMFCLPLLVLLRGLVVSYRRDRPLWSGPPY